jgi:predicted transcriptional regulator
MSKTGTHRSGAATTFMPVTTMEEVPVFTEAERADMLATLKQGEADITAGRATRLQPAEVEPWLRGKLEKARAKKDHGV